MTCVTLASFTSDQVSAAAAVAGVIVATFAIIWGRRDVAPPKRLSYAFEVTPLLTTAVDDVVVTRGGERLTHPHTATLKVTNTGEREFVAGDFNAEPIEFTLRARIIAKLSEETGDNRRVPPTDFHDDTLYVQPYAIQAGQEIIYKLLLDGTSPKATPNHNISGELEPDKRFQKRMTRWAIVAGVCLMAVIPIIIWVGGQDKRITENNLQRAYQNGYQNGYQTGKRDAEQRLKLSTPSPSANHAPEEVGGGSPGNQGD